MKALALVIGNADYALPKDKLINAVNDAFDFGKKLLNLGFVVIQRTDCTLGDFGRELVHFGHELKKFDIGLFYFSGHGLQIKGDNYLTAIDTNFIDDISAKHSSIPLPEIIEYMDQANPTIKILILDACRDNPLPSIYRGTYKSGLAPIHAPKGTIIAFSTSPGEKAMDYGSGKNSIYTGSLLKHIDDMNIPIEEFFKRVRTSVYTLSNGKQTSWEHTSLIGDFCFNSGQLIHSIDLPYKEEHIADENFQSSGNEIDEIIKKLRSHDWYKQNPAIRALTTLDKSRLDKSSMFLLGRNILQTADGGENSANHIIRNLDTWLDDWFISEENHVLNGILYEMYFNSKGQFRQINFKNSLIEEIFILQKIEKYKKSFEFIRAQLLPFLDFIFYVPTFPPATLPIEISFEKIEYEKNEIIKIAHKLISVKYQEIELLESNTDDELDLITVNYEKFLTTLKLELCVSIKNLTISMNMKEKDLKIIYIPWQMKLSKIRKNRPKQFSIKDLLTS
jgi:hypothetical protein